MGRNITNTTEQYRKDSSINGFYYDQQLNNNLLVASLHPNTIKKTESKEASEKSDNPATWKKIPSSDAENDSTNTEWPYSVNSICKCIIPEDFQVSIANNWADFGGDPLGQMWDQMKPLAPYVEKISEALSKMADRTSEYIAENPNTNYNTGALSAFQTIAKEGATLLKEKGADYLNRSLVVNGTRFTYYGGTGIDFSGALNMRFTLFFEYDKNLKDWRTVYDQVEEIIPYIVGDYIPVKEFNSFSESIQDWCSWQLPPGGFRSGLKDIEGINRGTLKLQIGKFYAVENLVIQSAQFNYSKVMAKHPKIISGKDMFTPLYCEVMLMLKPATRFSVNSLKRFVSGKSTQSQRQQFSKEVYNDMNSLVKTNYYDTYFTETTLDEMSIKHLGKDLAQGLENSSPI